jgi:SHAQKYF class myb-like DNA-binding protein
VNVAGRWTQEEHELFMQGLKMHNKQWKMIAEMIKTRTVVQIRTHAQKYFQKLLKLKNGCELNIDNIDSMLDPSIMSTIRPDGSGTDTAVINSPRTKRKQASARATQDQQIMPASGNQAPSSAADFVASCFKEEYMNGGSISAPYLYNAPKALGLYQTEVRICAGFMPACVSYRCLFRRRQCLLHLC